MVNYRIVLFLNFEHNIRVSRACFSYAKDWKNVYYLINIHNLQYTNLTPQLKQLLIRQQHLN